jgi:hypothetical protein
MILPSKHINISESILGLSGILLSYINKRDYSVDELWQEYSKVNNVKAVFPAYHSFDNMILAIDFLFLVDAIVINNNGLISIQ